MAEKTPWEAAADALRSAMKISSNIAKIAGIGGNLERDAKLLRSAAINLLLASDFPLPVLARLQKTARLDLATLDGLLSDPAVRVWLESWAGGARALRKPPGLTVRQ